MANTRDLKSPAKKTVSSTPTPKTGMCLFSYCENGKTEYSLRNHEEVCVDVLRLSAVALFVLFATTTEAGVVATGGLVLM